MSKPGPKALPRAERFWSKVDKSDGCWIWTGAINKLRGGYGAFYDDPEYAPQRLRRAHRVAYELATGADLRDPSVALRHTCDNPPCVNPAHLVPGTQRENLSDMRAKGRDSEAPHSRGEQRYNARLTAEDVRRLRAAHAAGASYSGLARELGASRSCVTAAIKGHNWTHVA